MLIKALPSEDALKIGYIIATEQIKEERAAKLRLSQDLAL